MKGKNGFLLGEETLKTVIAIMVILALIYFLVSLYYANSNAVERREAEATLKRISDVINAGGGNVNAITPDGWYLFGFTGEKKPNSCAGKNCICICDKVLGGDYFDRQIKECSKYGKCLEILGLESFNEIKINEADSITSIKLRKTDNKIFVEEIK